MSFIETVAQKINLVFNVNISSTIKYSKLAFDLIQKIKKCKNYSKGATLAD